MNKRIEILKTRKMQTASHHLRIIGIVPFRIQMHADEDRGDHVVCGDCEICAEPLHDDGGEAAGGGCHHVELRQKHRAQMRLERAQARLQREDGQRGGRAARVAEQ